MNGRWEFSVKDLHGDEKVMSFAAINGIVRVSSPRTWSVDAGAAREIGEAWLEACGLADGQRRVSPS